MINRTDTHILPVEFDYHSPESLEEAVAVLSKYGDDAKILAGGTDLLVQMKQRLVEPEHIINIKRIPGLRGIIKEENGFFIAAATKLREIERSEVIANSLPMLRETVKAMASVQIRNMATIGGNLCNASPAADTATALMALKAKVKIVGPTGERVLPLEEFFLSPGNTALENGELLSGIFIPEIDDGLGASFMKIGRTKLDIAIVNVAVSMRLEDGVINESRVALGAVAPVPLRLCAAEEWLRGKRPNAEIFGEVAKICCANITPIDDLRASAEYRMAAIEALVQDALVMACMRAGDN